MKEETGKKIKLVIDGNAVEAGEGKTILDAARTAGIKIPTLCFHPALEPFGACRICTVEVRLGRRSSFVTACNCPVGDGMEVLTGSERVIETRRWILEMLLARCPGVEVIRNLALTYGIEKPRFPTADETCMLCGLCVRVCTEVVGKRAINFAGRGIERKVDTPFHLESEDCMVCGACAFVCPTGNIRIEDRRGRAVPHGDLVVGPPSAIYTPTRQPVPAVPAIDRNSCIHMETGSCSICKSACERDAIDFEQKERAIELAAGAVIVATGFETFDPNVLPQYGYGRLDNVVTAPEVEKMSNASGPTGGEILLSGGQKPRSVAILHCIGSRDRNTNEHCSKVCCMYSLKLAHLIREKTGAQVTNFYIDIRAGGKGYEEFYASVQQEGVRFIRGKAAGVRSGRDGDPDESGRLVVEAEDTLISRPVALPVDMVVLSVGFQPRRDAGRLATTMRISRGRDGFFLERHIKLAPMQTFEEGIFIAGAAQGPKDITESVSHGAGAGLEALSLLDRGEIELGANLAVIDADLCTGCGVCASICPAGAVTIDARLKVARVDEAICKGCGACAAACPSQSADQLGFTERQIAVEIEGLLAI